MPNRPFVRRLFIPADTIDADVVDMDIVDGVLAGAVITDAKEDNLGIIEMEIICKLQKQDILLQN